MHLYLYYQKREAKRVTFFYLFHVERITPQFKTSICKRCQKLIASSLYGAYQQKGKMKCC